MSHDDTPGAVALRELGPLWPEAPRLCPERPLPPYRYVPGLTPHPSHSPQGHSYGVAEAPVSPLAPLGKEHPEYRYGIDLYHQGYLWESHGAWEGLWRDLPRSGPFAHFLQGLIQNSAAQLKLHVGVVRGAASLSESAWNLLQSVLDSEACDGTRCLGVDLPDLLNQMAVHYGPLWEHGRTGAGVAQGRPPRLVLD